MTPVEPGMQVDPINAWPSLETDALHAVGRATPSFGMQVGFYYKTFIRPRWAWKYYEKFLRSAAGLGSSTPPTAAPSGSRRCTATSTCS